MILSDALIGLDFDSFGQICALSGFSQRVLFRLNRACFLLAYNRLILGVFQGSWIYLARNDD